MKALNIHPLSVSIAANAIMFYSKGIFDDKNCGKNVNHAVNAVGYGSAGHQNYYIVRNSWGASWGENGYIRMSRDVQKDTGICSICTYALYPEVV